jgi:hypothetical protein
VTTTTENGDHRWRRLVAAAAAAAVMLLGGCTVTFPGLHYPGGHPSGHPSSSNPFDDSARPLNDDQAMAQVIEPAKQIVAAAKLDGVSGGFSFTSCNDQGDPPYRGKVTMTFLLHGDPDAYFQAVEQAMFNSGWNHGPLPGQAFHGSTLHKDGVTANMSYLPSDHAYGEMFLYGECRVTADHHHDNPSGADITDQLQSP